MPAAKFATGKFALGICDICGVSYRFFELRGTTVRGHPTYLMSCPICWDLDHPQNFLPDAVRMWGTDPEAIRNARPENDYPSRILPNWRPCDALLMRMALGNVEVLTP
jgi:hypothetical protein